MSLTSRVFPQAQRAPTALPPSPSPAPAPAPAAEIAASTAPAPLPVPLADLPERERQLATERAEFLRLVASRLEATGESEPVAVAEISAREGARFPLLRTAGHGGGNLLKIANYRRWKTAAAEPAAVARRWHRGRRQTTPGADHPFIKLVSRYFETENRLSLKHTCLLARTQARLAGLPAEQVLTYGQVSYFYQRHKDQNALLLARRGPEWFAENRCGYIERDWSDIDPGHCWFGDHHLFDAPVRVLEDGSWVAVRPWLTAWMDARSGYLVGWRLSAGLSPNTMAIEDALLNGIRAAGNRPPVVVYVDNGKDYSARGFAEPIKVDETDFSILLSLGCDPRRALPFNARAKTIERMFGSVAAQFARWFPGYRGNSPEHRPANAQEHWENAEDLPSVQQFTEAFAHWLTTFYHAQPNQSRISGGQPPATVWAARQPTRPALSDQELYYAFLHPVGLRTVERGGRVRIAGRLYQSQALLPRIGARVLVKADRFDPARCFAFEPDGRLLAPATLVERLPALAESDADRQRISDAMASNRRLLTHTRAILHTERGERVVPAVYDRLALATPAPAAPAAAPAAEPGASEADLAAFGASVRGESAAPDAAGSSLADFSAFIGQCQQEDGE